jgi:hypothetical protein
MSHSQQIVLQGDVDHEPEAKAKATATPNDPRPRREEAKLPWLEGEELEEAERESCCFLLKC